MPPALYNLEPLLFRLQTVKDAPLQLGRHDLVVLGRQYHDGGGADGREQMQRLPLGVAVEALDGHAVIEGRGVLLGGVGPGGQVVLLLGRELGEVLEEHQVLALVTEEGYIVRWVASELIRPILNCPGDDGRLVGRVEAPVGHQALRYDGRDPLVEGCGLEGYSGAPEEAPYGYAVRVDPALILQELSPLVSILGSRTKEGGRMGRHLQ